MSVPIASSVLTVSRSDSPLFTELPDEDMYLYSSTEFEGNLIDCNEGDLEWVPIDKVMGLNLWEGDRIFLKELINTNNEIKIEFHYDGDKLVGMAQLYVSQDMLADFKEEFGLTEFKVCELGGNLVLPEYRGNGITTKLQTMELQLARELGFDYIISMAHPEMKFSVYHDEKIGEIKQIRNGYKCEIPKTAPVRLIPDRGCLLIIFMF